MCPVCHEAWQTGEADRQSTDYKLYSWQKPCSGASESRLISSRCSNSQTPWGSGVSISDATGAAAPGPRHCQGPMKEGKNKTAVQNCHSVNLTVSISPLLISPPGKNPSSPDACPPHAIAVLSSGCACVCLRAVRTSMHLCLGWRWGAQKNICTGAYHHDVTLLPWGIKKIELSAYGCMPPRASQVAVYIHFVQIIQNRLWRSLHKCIKCSSWWTKLLLYWPVNHFQWKTHHFVTIFYREVQRTDSSKVWQQSPEA